MEFRNFIKNLSTPQLLTMRQIFVDAKRDELAVAEKHLEIPDKATLNALKQENKRLEKLNARREAVEAEDLEWDESYYMSLDDKTFNWVLGKLKNAKTEAANAEAERVHMKIPALFGAQELDLAGTIREGLKARRNGDGE